MTHNFAGQLRVGSGDQSRGAGHPTQSGEDMFGRELDLDEDPTTQVPPRR
jgi:hypothetical protein